MSFAARYGPWAVVAGASEGLGAAFATELSHRGLNLILVARRPEPLRDLSSRLSTETVTVAADLATPEGVAACVAAASGHEVGLVVANAAYSPIGAFVTLDASQSDQAVRVNCAAPVQLAHAFLPAMVSRGRGGRVRWRRPRPAPRTRRRRGPTVRICRGTSRDGPLEGVVAAQAQHHRDRHQ